MNDDSSFRNLTARFDCVPRLPNAAVAPEREEIEKKTLGNLESFRMGVIFMFLDSRIHWNDVLNR